MINFQLQQLNEQATRPTRSFRNSLGLDLYALVLDETSRPSKAIVPPRTTRLIHTGWAIKPPEPDPAWRDVLQRSREGEVWLAAVCSRSGLAKRSIFVANAPGIIDPDYRGEICVLLYNGGQETYYVEHKDRIAQLVAVQASMAEVDVIDDVGDSDRGDDGFGSTGR